MNGRQSEGENVLSIVIPAYNVARYLPDCLQSVFSQTGNCLNVEVVIIDDGSSDHTLEVASDCIPAECKPYARVISQENRGLGGARQTGVENSVGEWLFFLDSDDILLPGAVDAIFRAIAANPGADVIGFGWDVFPDARPEELQRGGQHILSTAPLQWPHQAWAKVFKRELLALAHAPSVPYEDLAYVPAMLRAAKVLAVDETSVMAYRVDRPSSAMSEKGPAKFKDVVAAADCALGICRRIVPADRQVKASEVKKFRTQKIVVDGFLDKVIYADSVPTIKVQTQLLMVYLKPSEIDYGTIKRYKGRLGVAVVAAVMHGDPVVSVTLYKWARRLKKIVRKAS